MLMGLLNAASGALSLLLLGLTAVLAAQVIAHVLNREGQGPKAQRLPGGPAPGWRPTLAVVVPAHNEASGIAATLASIRPQLGATDQLWVVADHCSDDTAALARASGAQVAEREGSPLRGKGYALAHGLDQLRAQPPALVVFIDADCTLEPGALDHLAAAVLRSDRPAQAEYLMRAAPGSALPRRVAEFTWRLRNSVRPSGGFHLGQPCQLMGTGMAFTWAMLEAAPVGTGSIVEDMALGIDLALQGHAPLFCPEAQVLSNFPDAAAAQATQQTRWIHGHLILLAQGCPRLIAAAWRRRDARLLGMALDLAVPPLSLLVVSLFAVGLLNLALYAALHLGGVPWAEVGAGTGSFGMIRTAWAALAVALALAWWSDGRDLITGWELLKLPLMLPAKLKILLRFVTRRQAAWVRTDRDPP